MTFEKKKESALPQTLCQGTEGKEIFSNDGFSESVQKPKLLLHSCCGPCSTAVIERLTDEFDITIFFYNPCITDEKEYQLRRKAQLEFIEKYNNEHIGQFKIDFKETEYRPTEFFEAVEGLENEPEGGARCTVCFTQRLERTAGEAILSGFDYFGTTLTVSPHKNYKLISDIGRNLALKYGVSFLDRDFKKKDGFRRSTELSKKYGLYRQNYCGCEYSIWDK